MNIEQKMEYIRRALELGANVYLNFHNFNEKSEAEKTAVELSRLAGVTHQQKSNNGTHWYKIQNDDYSLESSIFYDKYLEEDVVLDGMKEGENIA
jgi:hypothetical protein